MTEAGSHTESERRLIEDARQRAAEQDERIARRRRARLKGHAIVGALITFFLLWLMGVLGIGGAAAMALLVGAPAGLLVSLRGGGLFQGAGIGVLCMAVGLYLMHGFAGEGWSVNVLTLFGYALLLGGIPGVLIGAHVQFDR